MNFKRMIKSVHYKARSFKVHPVELMPKHLHFKARFIFNQNILNIGKKYLETIIEKNPLSVVILTSKS